MEFPAATAPGCISPIRWNDSTVRSSAGRMLPVSPMRRPVIYRLVAAILLDPNDEWSIQRARYITLETIAALSDDDTVSLPSMTN
jgi:hypothetical protein